MLRFADKVVAVSNPLKELLVHRGVNPSTIEVIQNAVDSKELKPDLKAEEVRGMHGILKDDIVVGVVGRFGPEKGQAVFLQALTLLKKRMVKIKALLIGDGSEKERLIEYCHDHELIDYVIFTGYQENIANYYQIMDLLVIPSFSEGLPNVLLEAMAMGIPVVATAVGGITEVVEKTSGELVTAGDVEEMSRSIELIIMDEKLRSSMSKKARKKVLSLFSAENRANQIIRLYQNILSEAACY